MLGIGLALAASLTWGVADFLGGLKSRQLALLAVLLFSQLCGLTAIGVAVAVRDEPVPGGEYIVLALLSGAAGFTGVAAFYRAMAIGSMSVVAPISSTAAAVPLVVGVATGDRLTFLQGDGVLLAMSGVALASREEADEAGESTRVATGLGLALLSAVGFGAFFVAMDAASEADATWALFFNRLTSLSLIAAAVVAFRPSLAVGRGNLLPLAAIGLLEMAANTLFAFATQHGLVSIVSVLSSLYPVTTVFLAYLVLHERIARLQQAGVVAALAGVALISAG